MTARVTAAELDAWEQQFCKFPPNAGQLVRLIAEVRALTQELEVAKDYARIVDNELPVLRRERDEARAEYRRMLDALGFSGPGPAEHNVREEIDRLRLAEARLKVAVEALGRIQGAHVSHDAFEALARIEAMKGGE